ncbi:MAG: hypothetical protein D6732_00280 [Methanobacteriota archaeon]|nr:MAG: hypothetical protein D6732_00280 [Euryarchaeota archaeon]
MRSRMLHSILLILLLSPLNTAFGQEFVAKYEFRYHLSVLEYQMKTNPDRGYITGMNVTGFFYQHVFFANGTELIENQRNSSDVIPFTVNSPKDDQYFYKFYFGARYYANKSDYEELLFNENFMLVFDNGTLKSYPGFNATLPSQSEEGEGCIRENRLENICSLIIDNSYWFFNFSLSIKRTEPNKEGISFLMGLTIFIALLFGWVVVFIILMRRRENQKSFFDY